MDVMKKTSTMRVLAGDELAAVAGGVPPAIPILAAVGATVAFIYNMGKDAALRDRAYR